MADHFEYRSLLPDSRGFTLIEALVALAVLTLGILTVYTMQSGSVRGNYRAGRITTAAVWAGDRMEYFNGLDYGDPQLEDEKHDGSGQDANKNGIDDDEEGLAVDGIANFGLDQDSVDTADHTVSGELDGFTMHYNIAVDQPIAGMKTIRILVVRDGDRQTAVFDYYKAASL